MLGHCGKFHDGSRNTRHKFKIIFIEKTNWKLSNKYQRASKVTINSQNPTTANVVAVDGILPSDSLSVENDNPLLY